MHERYDDNIHTFPYLINSIDDAVVVRILGAAEEATSVFLGVDNGVGIMRRIIAVDGSIALIVPIKDGIIVRIKGASALVYHCITARLDTVDHWALIGIGRGVAKVHGIGNKIGVRVGAAHDGEILGHGITTSVSLKLAIESKAVRSGCGHTVVDGVWHTVHVKIGATINGTHGICVRAPIGTIDHTIQI